MDSIGPQRTSLPLSLPGTIYNDVSWELLLMVFSEHTISAVKEWLSSAGIAHDRIEQTQSLGWLSFDATADEAENLLKTKYHVYEHEGTGQPHIACEEYNIPSNLRDKIDFITPTLHFDAKLKPRETESDLEKRVGSQHIKLGSPGSGSLPKVGQQLAKSDLITQLSNCANQVRAGTVRFDLGAN